MLRTPSPIAGRRFFVDLAAADVSGVASSSLPSSSSPPR
jgi:hypothetical protein